MTLAPEEIRVVEVTTLAAAPEFGEHTEEILLECGYGWEDIARLKEEGVSA